MTIDPIMKPATAKTKTNRESRNIFMPSLQEIDLTRKIHCAVRLFGHKVLSLSELMQKQHFINPPKYEE
jgi:hypothetical protein